MNKQIVLILAAIIALALANDQSAPIETLLETFQDTDNFKEFNPPKLIPLAKTSRHQFVYTAGSRVSGDQQVATESNRYTWSTPYNVILYVNYPRSAETGAVVSYVEIAVEQSSEYGQVFITDGGVGQRNISLVVEAYGTSYFNYEVKIYGTED